MVAAALGLLLLAGIGTMFLATSRSYRENDLIAGMQDQARFAMASLSRDLAMAGYWGGMLGTDNLRPNLADADTLNDETDATVALPATADCGVAGERWTFRVERALEFRNQGGPIPWSCVGNVREGTDALAIRHVAGQTTSSLALGESAPNLRVGHFYLQTNGTLGTLTRWNGALNALNVPATAPMSFQRYTPRIYFVRDFSLTPGDGIPTLCRKELCPRGYVGNSNPELASCNEAGSGGGSTPGWYTECLAEGVEDLQIVWGLDSPDDDDFIVDRYSATPTPQEIATQARSAQIHLLMRSRRGDPQHVDEKVYTLADKGAFKPTAVADAAGTLPEQRTRHFYRRAYSTTVQLRNLSIQGGENVR